METLDENTVTNDTLIVNQEIKNYLLETAKWMKFLAILGFVGIGLMIIASLVMFAFGNNMSRSYEQPIPTYVLAILYLAGCLLYYFPIHYLYKTSILLKEGLIEGIQDDLISGFRYLKMHYKYIGISMIVVLSLYVLFFIIILILIIWKNNVYN